jgi:hypothetical protein
VDRITRKELKSDRFALEVEHGIDFFAQHRAQAVRYGAIALGVIVLIVVFSIWSRHQHSVREQALASALQAREAPVGEANPTGAITFPTDEAKQQETLKRFSEVATRYSGSDEGRIAQYYVGVIDIEQGKPAEAEKQFKQVADSGSSNYASLAQLSLAQIYFSDGRTGEAEKVLRNLIAHPTTFVSKEQATITLARGLMTTKPAEARKLVEPLRAVPGQVGQVAISLHSEIPAQ